MSWWVGGYIEAGMGAGGSSGAPYLPFAFEAANENYATLLAGAKLLAGPFATQSAADNWVSDYEKNPNTLHAGNDLSSNPSKSVVKGDSPPNPAGAFSLNVSPSAWLRVAEGVLGILLIAVGVAGLTDKVPVATKIARTFG